MNQSDFTPAVPTPDQVSALEAINKIFYDTAQMSEGLVPPSAHRTAALRLLLQAKMTLTHAITHPTEETQR